MGELTPKDSTRAGRVWAPAAAVAVLIFVLSSIPGSTFPQIEFRLADKIAHAIVYAMLGATVSLGLHKHKADRGWGRVILWVTLIAGLYGISDEVHQLFTPNRSADVWDVVADAVGGLIGVLVYVGVAKLRKRR